MDKDPLIVERGTPGGPTVILLDSAEVPTGQLFETWAALGEYVRLVCFGGFALEDPLVEARVLLEHEAHASSELYLVACPEGAHIASLLAGHRPDAVRGMFLVRAQPDGPTNPPATSHELNDFLRAQGVFARSVIPGVGGGSVLDRPEAAEAITRELVALGVAAVGEWCGA